MSKIRSGPADVPSGATFGTSFAIENPKLIIDVAVRTQAMSVRSWASRVRSTASSVDSDAGVVTAAVDRPSTPWASMTTRELGDQDAFGGYSLNIRSMPSLIFAAFSPGLSDTASDAVPRQSILLLFVSTRSTMIVPMVTGVTVVDVERHRISKVKIDKAPVGVKA